MQLHNQALSQPWELSVTGEPLLPSSHPQISAADAVPHSAPVSENFLQPNGENWDGYLTFPKGGGRERRGRV